VRRRGLRLVQPPDQVLRLRAYQRANPGIVIGAIESGCWQAVQKEGSSETVTTGLTLEHLLDKLDASQPGHCGVVHQ
jgi:hypothetical protein